MEIERKDPDKKAPASESMFLAIFMALDEGAVLQDGSGKIVAVNPAAENILGLAATELIGRSVADFAQTLSLVNKDETAFRWELHPALLAFQTGKPQGNVLLGTRRPDGTLRWISVGARPLVSDGKSGPHAVVTTLRDITERRRAEEALYASEERMRLFFERQLVGMAFTSPEKVWLQVNDKTCEMLGYSREELTRLTWSELTYPDDLAPEMAQFERLLDGKIDAYTLEKRFVRKDGGIVFANLAVGCVRRTDRSVDYLLALLEDITERKRMEDEIRRREREVRTLVQNSPDSIFRYDRDCRRLFVHAGSAPTRHGTVESLLGSTPADGRIVAGDEAKKLMASIRQVFDTAAPVTIHLDIVDDYGSPRDYQIQLVPELDENGKTATVLSLGRDTTAIRDAERQMTQFVANLPGFAFTFRLSPEGRGSFPFVSPGVEKLFELKPEDLKDDMAPLLAVTHPDDLPHVMAAIDESVRTITPFRVETRAARPGMPMRWGELRAVPVRQTDGSVLWHGIMLDIDRRKRNEAELAQHRHHLERLVEERTLALSIAKETAEAATRTKSHFLAAASHDLRQPLQAIRLFNDVLAMSGLNEQQQKIGNSLSKAVASLSELFNDLLDLSRLDAGTIEPRLVAIQADDLMGMIGAEFDPIFHQKQLRLNLFWPRQGLALFSDGTLLQTMLRNLIANAVKYTLRGGVLVSIRRRGDRALIQVWDTGIGIATEKMESVFEEYFQIGNPERDRAKGVGLGLAIVRRLSRLLDIGVRLRSREGKGSVFELSVPLAKESDIQASPTRPSASLGSIPSARLPGKRIVVIEDDATAAEAIKLSLEMDGALVTLFGSAEDALVSGKAMGADYYISDYRLPGMDGLQLLNAIQRISVEPIKAVVLTGNTAPDQVEQMQSSRWKVLFKPVGIPQLLSALDAHETAHHP